MTPPSSRLASVCRLLNEADVAYVVVGGFALAYHGVVRATKDVDILIEPTIGNARRALEALAELTWACRGSSIRRSSSPTPSPSSATILASIF